MRALHQALFLFYFRWNWNCLTLWLGTSFRRNRGEAKHDLRQAVEFCDLKVRWKGTGPLNPRWHQEISPLNGQNCGCVQSNSRSVHGFKLKKLHHKIGLILPLTIRPWRVFFFFWEDHHKSWSSIKCLVIPNLSTPNMSFFFKKNMIIQLCDNWICIPEKGSDFRLLFPLLL